MTENPPQDNQTDEDPFPDDDDHGAQLAVRDADAGTLEVFPPARGVLSEARTMLAEHRAMLDDAYYTANVVCQTPLAPQRYRGKPKEGTVAIMYGAELGLPPMASLQKVINIHGMPSIEARTMKGLLKTKGFQFRTVKKTDTEFEIHAWEPTSDKRTDPPDEIAHWTIDRAIKARYVPTPSSPESLRRPDVDTDWVTVSKMWDGKTKTSVVGNMKYITDPTTMLEAKGTADVCRAIAPEILMGLPYASEERDDWADDDGDDEPQPKRRGRAKGVNSLRDRAKAAGAKAEERAEAAADEPQDAEVVEPDSGATVQSVVDAAVAATSGLTPTGHDQAVAADALNQFLGYAPPKDPTKETAGSGAENADPAAPKAEADQPAAAASAPDPAPEDSGAAAPASAQPAAAPDQTVTVTREEGVTGEDIPMSPQNRSRGVAMLEELLTEAELDDDDDRLVVVAEVRAKVTDTAWRAVPQFGDLTNLELKQVVDTLRAAKLAGRLYDYCGEALNAAVLRETGLTEGQN